MLRLLKLKILDPIAAWARKTPQTAETQSQSIRCTCQDTITSRIITIQSKQYLPQCTVECVGVIKTCKNWLRSARSDRQRKQPEENEISEALKRNLQKHLYSMLLQVRLLELYLRLLTKYRRSRSTCTAEAPTAECLPQAHVQSPRLQQQTMLPATQKSQTTRSCNRLF